MPAVTLSTTVDLAKIKMKWKEQYVSEGLNHKAIPTSAKGVYSGLQLVENITTTRKVDIQKGSDTTHAAVHLSADGFALTYYDAVGTTITLDLSSASLDNQETVIALAITYTIGADTTANWMAYPIADWNALSAAQQAELLVIGTIMVPAAATNITSSMLLQRRRNVAWDSVLRGAVPWSPLLRNSGFEHGVAGGTNPYDITDWVNDSAPTNGVFRMGATAVNSGNYSLEFNKTSTSASNAVFTQRLEVPVTPGAQNYRFVCYIRQLIAPTAGSYKIVFYWGDQNSSTWLNTATTVSAAGTDAAFRKIDEIIEVPGGSYFLKYVTIEVSGVTSASTGVAVCFDDFQVYLEQVTPYARSGALQSAMRALLTAALVVEDSSSYAPGQLAALLRFDKSSPTNEGQLVIERRDQNYTGANLPPAVELFGRLLNLGSKVAGSAANARLPRVTAPYYGGVGPTLLLQSDNNTGGYSIRLYASADDKGFFVTVNASYDGTHWNKDVNGTTASKFGVHADYGLKVQTQSAANNTPWTFFAWDFQPIDIYADVGRTELFGTTLSTGTLTATGSNLTPDASIVQINSGGSSQGGRLLEVQGMIDALGSVSISPFGGFARAGSYFFDDFNQNLVAADANLYTVTNLGAGFSTFTQDPHSIVLIPGSTSGNSVQVATANYTVKYANKPRFSARVWGVNMNPTAVVGSASKVGIGFDNIFFKFDQTLAQPNHWYLTVDGVNHDTGLVCTLDAGTGTSASQILYLAVVSPTQVVVAVHDQNDTWSAATQAVVSVATINTTRRAMLSYVINNHSTDSPNLWIDFWQSEETKRLDG